MPIGDGSVDWRGFIATLAEGDFAGCMMIERECGEDRIGDVRKAIDRLSATMRDLAQGARRVAMVTGITMAEDVAARVRELRKRIHHATGQEG